MGADLKNRKKRKLKKRYWLLIDWAVVLVILVLLLYKPSRYDTSDMAAAGDRQGQVSSYLTHELLPQLYNGSQRQESFDLVVIQKGINEAIAQSKWPKESEGTRFSTPEVFFVPDKIVLMGAAVVSGVELVITIVAEPTINQQGLLNLRVAKVRIGAMNITPLARMIAGRMYQQRLDRLNIDTDNLRAKIAASLLNNEPFEPVFEIDGKKVRLEKIKIEREKLTARLIPAQ